MTCTGLVTYFVQNRGFGFIEADNFPGADKNIFFHVSQLRPRPKSNALALQIFQQKRVNFEFGTNPKTGRVCANNVRLAAEGPPNMNAKPRPSSPYIIKDVELDEGSYLEGAINNHRRDADDDFEILDDGEWLTFENGMLPENNTTGSASRFLANLDAVQSSYRNAAIEMGFPCALVNQAFSSLNAQNVPRTYQDLDDLCSELLSLQATDRADFSQEDNFEPESDDFRFQTWLHLAEEMGLPMKTVLDCLSSQIGGFNDFEELVVHVLAMEEKAEKLRQTVAKENSAQRLSRLKAECEAMRDYFKCRICMEADAGVIFVPCGHLCYCVQCAANQSDCPYCRKPCVKIVKAACPLDPPLPDLSGIAQKTSQAEELRLVEEQLGSMSRIRRCQKCQKCDRNCYFAPCNHAVYCWDCSQKMDGHCVICKVAVIEKRHFYTG